MTCEKKLERIKEILNRSRFGNEEGRMLNEILTVIYKEEKEG